MDWEPLMIAFASELNSGMAVERAGGVSWSPVSPCSVKEGIGSSSVTDLLGGEAGDRVAGVIMGVFSGT